jgi:predicted oxidoreductase
MADADVIVVGAGLAGLVAACELVERGRRVLIIDQENEANIGGALFLLYAPVGVLCLLLLAVAARLQPRLGRDDGRVLR